MRVKKGLDLNIVHDVITKVTSDLNYSLYERIELFRFLHKLSDSEKFECSVNRQFSAIKLKTEKEDIDNSLNNRVPIFMNCGFQLVPVQSTNWELYLNNELFLDQLDKKIARKIAFDINVAYLIKVSRNTRINND